MCLQVVSLATEVRKPDRRPLTQLWLHQAQSMIVLQRILINCLYLLKLSHPQHKNKQVLLSTIIDQLLLFGPSVISKACRGIQHIAPEADTLHAEEAKQTSSLCFLFLK